MRKNLAVPDVDEIEIPIAGLRLTAKAWGPADGPKVLGMHGWLDNAATFDGIAARLVGLRLVALDLPGHGRSDHLPVSATYAFIDWIPVVDQVLDALGWDRCTILGHSMGAAIGALWAGTFPDRVSRLILLEGLGPLSEKAEDAPERLARALTEEAAKRDKVKVPPVYPDEQTVLDRLQASVSRMQPESARTLLARGLEEVEGGVTWRTDPRLRIASRLRLTEDHVLAFMQRVTAPTLLVRAKSGYPFTAAGAKRRLEALGDVEVVEVEGGHHVHLDDPEPVAAAIEDFLERHN